MSAIATSFGGILRLIEMSVCATSLGWLEIEVVSEIYPICKSVIKFTLRIMKVCKLVKKLENEGWLLCRITGSHRQFKHPNRKELITIPGKLSQQLPLGTLHNIFKKARFHN